MDDNITPLFPGFAANDTTATDKEPTLPIWQVTFKDDKTIEVFGELMMSPITFAFYDFEKNVDSIIAIDMVKMIERDGELSEAEWNA